MAESPAADIVASLGGAGNIESLSHCATRLRFQLVDSTGIDQKVVEKIPGVMGAVPQAGNRYQVVIGGGVQTVFNDINALPEMKGGGRPSDADLKKAAREGGVRGKVAWLDSLFEFLSDSFRPILGALLGASLFITFMALASSLGWIGNWADPRTELPVSWQFVNLMWQCVFVFLPLMVAYNATKKLGADPWVGFAIMAVLMLPGFTGLAAGVEPTALFGFDAAQVSMVTIWGLPLPVANYSSQVFPPLLMAAVLGPLYKLLRKLIPENLQLIFVPFFSMLIMIPLTAFLIGPIGVYVGAGLAQLLSAINSFSPLIFAIIIPLAYPFMVPLGLHWPINAIMLLNIQTLGYDFIQGPMGAWNFACFGATAGVLIIALRQKDRAMEQTATGALAAGLLGGISEPSLYGIHLRFKRIYPRMLVGCLVGGLIIGFGSMFLGLPNGVTTQAFVFTSLLTIPAFNPIGLYAIAVLAAFATSMLLILFTGYQTPEQKAELFAQQKAEAEAEAAGSGESVADAAVAASAAGIAAASAGVVGGVIEIGSPLDGTVVPLDDVPDPVFAGGTMGPGVAIQPIGNTVYAPGGGIVAAAQPTGHAFGLVLDGGVELLIHVGIDTVNLQGEGFDVKVKNGDRIEAGQALVTFDRKIIEDAGYPLITPVIVLNAEQFDTVDPIGYGDTTAGTPILSVGTKAAKPVEPAGA